MSGLPDTPACSPSLSMLSSLHGTPQGTGSGSGGGRLEFASPSPEAAPASPESASATPEGIHPRLVRPSLGRTPSALSLPSLQLHVPSPRGALGASFSLDRGVFLSSRAEGVSISQSGYTVGQAHPTGQPSDQDDAGSVSSPRPATVQRPMPELTYGRIIGRGASSEVRQAWSSDGTPVAVKSVRAIYDKAKRDQVLAEIAAPMEECDAIVHILGVQYVDGSINIALEYMDADVFKRAQSALPEAALAGIAFQALWGLAFLRCESRLHRDIKPANLLVSSAGEVKLSDFGLSRVLESTDQGAMTHLGTLLYMAPERLAATDSYAYPADVWSLGVVLLEGALGHHPLEGTTRNYLDVLLAITEEASIMFALPKGARDATGQLYSDEMRDFFSHMLQQDPQDRWTAEELLEHHWLDDWDCVDMGSAREIVRTYLGQLGAAVDAQAAAQQLESEVTDAGVCESRASWESGVDRSMT